MVRFALSGWQKLERMLSLLTETSSQDTEQDAGTLEPLHHFHAHWLPGHIHSQPQAPVPLFWVPLSHCLNPNVCPLGGLIQV